jgi:hypothetical protein
VFLTPLTGESFPPPCYSSPLFTDQRVTRRTGVPHWMNFALSPLFPMAFVPCVLRPRYYSGGPSASVPDPLLLPELSKLSFSPFALLPPLAPYKCWPYTLLGPPLLLGPLAGSADPSPLWPPLGRIYAVDGTAPIPSPPLGRRGGRSPAMRGFGPILCSPRPPPPAALSSAGSEGISTDTTRKNTPFGFGFVYIFSCPHRRRFSRVLVRSPSLPRDPLIYTPH